VPFAEAHEIAGALVLLAEQRGIRLDQLSAADLATVDDRLGADLLARLRPEAAIALRVGAGGTAPDRVREQIERFRRRIASLMAEASDNRTENADA
jgi:argininosuccinate lyase